MQKQAEYDKLQNNIIVISNINMESDMTNATTYHKKEIEQGGMKVVFEFPEASENDNQIKQEVKEILKGALQEQLKKIS